MTADEMTPTERRLVEAGTAIRSNTPAPSDLDFQHTILCQTGLPYRDPGIDRRVWDRRQGAASLRIEAGSIVDPRTGEFRDVGLPFGQKARLVLIHLSSEAKRTGSPMIEVEDSLTAFVGAIGLSTDGRTIGTVKDQLGRLSTATVRLAYRGEGRAVQVNSTLVRGLELWAPNDARQRMLWPSTVELSADFFRSVQDHAVPLDRRAIGALSHSAMALDIYCWLAQRLRRVPTDGQVVPWRNLHDQFGPSFGRLPDFKKRFKDALHQVLAVYPQADVDQIDGEGLMLRESAPPVPERLRSARLSESSA